MANVSNYALRLQASLLEEVRKIAQEEGTTINQFINVAVAEKLSALKTEEYFKSRAAKGDRAGFRRILDKAGKEDPREGDELAK
jgi:hypothetical protein